MGEEPKCLQCGACCKRLRLQFKMTDEFDELVRAHYGVPNAEALVIRLKHRCIHLDENNLCKIHDDPKRPKICQEFLCEAAKGNQPHRIVIDLEDNL